MASRWAILLLLSGTDVSAQVEKMSKEELKAMLGKPELVVIDVRQAGDLAKSNLKIKGAVREDPKQDSEILGGQVPQGQDDRPLLCLTRRRQPVPGWHRK